MKDYKVSSFTEQYFNNYFRTARDLNLGSFVILVVDNNKIIEGVIMDRFTDTGTKILNVNNGDVLAIDNDTKVEFKNGYFVIDY